MNYTALIIKIKKIIPASLFRNLQRWYRSNIRILLPRLTEQEIRSILTEKLGLKNGSVVFIHSSVDRMRLDFPFYKLFQILTDIVGKEEGSLIFPTAHFDARAEDFLTRNPGTVIFDVRKSPTVRGLLPEFARKQKNAVRSLHPTESVAVLGKHAIELTGTHHQSIYPCGELSPFYKMMEYDGLIVGLGVTMIICCLTQISIA